MAERLDDSEHIGTIPFINAHPIAVARLGFVQCIDFDKILQRLVVLSSMRNGRVTVSTLNDAFVQPHLLPWPIVSYADVVGQLQQLSDLSEPVITPFTGSVAAGRKASFHCPKLFSCHDA